MFGAEPQEKWTVQEQQSLKLKQPEISTKS